MNILLWGGGAGAPFPNSGGGGLRQGAPRATRLISSIQMYDNFGSNVLMGWGGEGGRGGGMYWNG